MADFKETVKQAGDTIVGYIKDASTLTVETNTVEVGTGAAPQLAARTVISLDGDNSSTVPAQRNEAGILTVDAELYTLHMQNVQAATDYRARMLDSMISLLKSRLG